MISEVPHLLFGKGELPVRLPSGCAVQVMNKPPMPVEVNAGEVIMKALADSGGGVPLRDLAGRARSACIVICDITRPVPNGLILPPIIRTLLEKGMAADNICVLVATGLHRPNEGEELRELVGSDWVLQTVRIENHFARDADSHVLLGNTRKGTPVSLDRRFVEADLKIVTGLVEPHFMAGYSGGRKVIAPGIAHEETIRTFHNTTFMENPLARSGNLAGNPLHDEQLEIVGMLGTVYAVNTVLDDQRRLSFVNFGEVISSHAEAVDHVRRFAEVPLHRESPLVITSSAGYPLDKTYYQTIKGMVAALPALQQGGTLLIASECSEGVGSEEFCEAQRKLVALGVGAFLEEARRRPFASIDEWQTVKLTEALRKGRVHLFAPGLSPKDQDLTGVICHSDWETALAAALAESNAGEALVIPEGPYVSPVLRVN
jgi:nickel-dependent lactate racemase